MLLRGWQEIAKDSFNPLSCEKRCGAVFLLFLLLSVALGGCSTFTTERNDTEMLRELERRRQQWSDHNIDSYQYVYVRNCNNCEPEEAGPFEVFVLDGEIESVIYEEEAAPSDPTPPYYTINDLFDLIEKAIRQEPDRIRMQFDPDFSFPIRVFIDLDLGTIRPDHDIDVTEFNETTKTGE